MLGKFEDVVDYMSQGLSFKKTKHSGFVFAIHIY